MITEEGFVGAIQETLNTDYTIAHSSSQLIKTQIQDWEAEHGEGSLPEEVIWEKIALDLYNPHRRRRQGSPQEHFEPMSKFPIPNSEPPEVRIYPDVGKLMSDDRAISYYQQRIKETPNPIRRARYADIVYCASSQQPEEAYKYGMVAADAYLTQVSLCLDQNRYPELINCLDRATEFALLFNNRELASRSLDHLRIGLKEVVSQEGFLWALWLCKTLIFLSKKFENIIGCEIWIEVKVICDEGISHCKESGDWKLATLFMELGQDIANIEDDKTKVWDYRVQKADYLKQQSRKRESLEGPIEGSLIAFRFMEMTAHAYQRLISLAPDDDKKELMREEAAEALRETRRLICQSEEEMQEHQVSIPIPREALEKGLVEPLLAAPSGDTMLVLARHPELVPDIDNIRAQAADTAEQQPLHYLISQIRLRGGRKIDETSLYDDESAQLMEHLGYWFQMHIRLLDFALHRLKEESRFNANLFIDYIKQWEFLSEADLPFIETGIERYFSGDFISALHVLTPRVEHMLKSALEQAGVSSVVVPNQRQIREQTFGSFLHRPDVRASLGEAIWYYLDYALVNEWGLNIRNDVAHGWVGSPQCNRFPVQIILFAILLLTRLNRADRP
jgi:hypothetical protein